MEDSPAELVTASDADDGSCSRTQLGPTALITLGLGGIIGAGIFFSIGMAITTAGGTPVFSALLIAALACFAVALCYCECASAVPDAGSAYAYARVCIGEFGGWISGFNLATCYLLAGAAVSKAWSGYFQNLLTAFGAGWPRAIGSEPLVMSASGGVGTSGMLLNLPAALGLAGVTLVARRGLRISLMANQVLLILKLSVLALVIVLGLAHTHPENWISSKPEGGILISPKSDIFAAATMLFFAFGGFEMLSVYSQECRNPRTDVPRGVAGTIAIVTLIYGLTAAALVGMTPHNRIDVSAPLSAAFRDAGMTWVGMLIAAGALIALTSVLLLIVMSLPRLLMAISEEGLLPRAFFGRIHPVFGTPSRSITGIGISLMLLGALVPIDAVMQVVMMATLVGYISVCTFVLLMRRDRHQHNPPFRIPGGPLVPIIGIAVCAVLLSKSPPVLWVWLTVWWGIGTAVYAAYGKRHRTGIRQRVHSSCPLPMETE
jgi:APA family basic amino acid/polyamine antiporter